MGRRAVSASPEEVPSGVVRSSGMYAVIACPRCRRARVVEPGRKSAGCGTCGRVLELADLRVQHESAHLDEARHAAGMLNARLAGREDEYLRALLPVPAAAPRHDSPESAAAAASRRASSEADRADAVARELARQTGEFEEGELVRAFHLAGLRDPPRHLKRMLDTMVLYEPRAGRYTAL